MEKQPFYKSQKFNEIIEEVRSLIYWIIPLLALRWTIIEPYVVPTGSMEPTLKPGDRLYALKCAYDIRLPFTSISLVKTLDIKRGDVFLFKAPPTPNVTFVKRVIGIPGDKIEFRNGELYVNREKVERFEPPYGKEIMYDIERNYEKKIFVENLTGKKHFMILDEGLPNLRDFDEITIPPDNVFAVGDNRDNSHDSRAWGFVPVKNIIGKAMFIWFSSFNYRIRFERIGTLIQ